MIDGDLIIDDGAGAPGAYALIVHDQDNVSQGLAAAINALGVENSVCKSLKAAIASFDERRPDIIFLDVSLHQGEVIHLVEALRARSFRGTLQLMCGGGRLQLAKIIQTTAEASGLHMRPPVRRPYRLADIRAAILDAFQLNA